MAGWCEGRGRSCGLLLAAPLCLSAISSLQSALEPLLAWHLPRHFPTTATAHTPLLSGPSVMRFAIRRQGSYPSANTLPPNQAHTHTHTPLPAALSNHVLPSPPFRLKPPSAPASALLPTLNPLATLDSARPLRTYLHATRPRFAAGVGADYFETSAKDGIGINPMFEHLFSKACAARAAAIK